MRDNKKKKKRRWKAGLKWFIVFVLISLFLLWLHELLDHIHFLAEKVNEQSQTIDHLRGQLDTVTNQLQLEHTKVEKLSDIVNERLTQKAPEIKIGGQPVTPEPHVELPKAPDPKTIFPIVISGGAMLLKSLLAPVLP